VDECCGVASSFLRKEVAFDLCLFSFFYPSLLKEFVSFLFVRCICFLCCLLYLSILVFLFTLDFFFLFSFSLSICIHDDDDDDEPTTVHDLFTALPPSYFLSCLSASIHPPIHPSIHPYLLT